MDNYIFGKKIITDPNMLMCGEPVLVKRTVCERLFARPWRPFERTRVKTPLVPSTEILYTNEYIMCHPAMVEEMKKACK